MELFFKCSECTGVPCILCVDDSEDRPYNCPYSNNTAVWGKVKGYELIKKEPDYQAMAERKQFGKFWDKSNKYVYSHFFSYDSSNGYPFHTEHGDLFMHFTPMTEPKEIEL